MRADALRIDSMRGLKSGAPPAWGRGAPKANVTEKRTRREDLKSIVRTTVGLRVRFDSQYRHLEGYEENASFKNGRHVQLLNTYLRSGRRDERD